VSIFVLDAATEAAVEQLERSMVEAVQDGNPRLVLAVDPVLTFDNQAIRAVITLLRRVRERGGELVLRTARTDVLRTLSVTGLDHVFAIEREAFV
jgi:anti-sigma B factor antagonist